MANKRVFNLLKPSFTKIKTIEQNIQAIFDYFRLQNKVLWTGTAGKGATITVPNLSKYQIIRLKAVYGDCLVDVKSGRIRALYGDRSGSSDTTISGLVFAAISGDKITINNCNWIMHNPSSSHGAIQQTKITEITGVVPAIPAALQQIITPPTS